ncbi:dethiobiotin synthase [Thalassotalea sp. LPB0316]|uniref:dethiobiotin synthase n=1 Tax=Thalassotalea sp. LPB0316 TaxID=2769490 RepID=UPI0018673B49|nr:dethiobiotin synthase [Thalassotalea sp. LPB0316]QOL24848.1 dethiobiotin synthase [Thalassotalea sp. LPB0316]
MKTYFITATDTDAGKTFIGCALTHLFQQQGKTLVFKPISAGCELIDGQLVNEDAKLLGHYAGAKQTITEINPIAFQDPIAPHIAAAKANCQLSAEQVSTYFDQLVKQAPDYLITEGAGGWRLPLGNKQFLSDFAKQTKQQVILVVNMKLGCLNHAQLTYETIKADGLDCVGWVANCIETMPYLAENLAELNQLFDMPCLGVVSHCASIEEAAQQLNIGQLL